MLRLIITLCLGCCAMALWAVEDTPALIDTDGLREVTAAALQHREHHLIDVASFVEKAAASGTVILDTRSAAAYARKHIAGAINLPFSDFTAAKLAALIPDPDTEILIYCNNNILGSPPAFESKAMPLALNLPTYINLFGYGYRNVWELDRAIRLDDERIRFAGSDFDQK